MSEHPTNPDLRPDDWPTEGLIRHTFVLKGLMADDEVPCAITLEFPKDKGMVAVRMLRDYARSLGLELMRELHTLQDASVAATVEVTIREFADKGIVIGPEDILTEGPSQ